LKGLKVGNDGVNVSKVIIQQKQLSKGVINFLFIEKKRK